MTLYNCHHLIVTIAGVALLAGCSYVPDRLNPVEWTKTGYDWIMGEDNNSDSDEEE